ncbi:hypothetical protein PL75_02805 [Neisseria arctica]|uniref:Uncharacterized protein n=1 Tax=Neisseria arctica TaxID=1470200 RepID=A0A0J0YTS6_9NEIS|nr:hypothetical protein PL75_02805 [Neisseria arctica]
MAEVRKPHRKICRNHMFYVKNMLKSDVIFLFIFVNSVKIQLKEQLLPNTGDLCKNSKQTALNKAKNTPAYQICCFYKGLNNIQSHKGVKV